MHSTYKKLGINISEVGTSTVVHITPSSHCNGSSSLTKFSVSNTNMQFYPICTYLPPVLINTCEKSVQINHLDPKHSAHVILLYDFFLIYSL